jgi:hypothetical protein
MHGLNMFAGTYSNPGGLALNAATFGAYGLYVGIKSGLNFGKGDSAARAQQEESMQIQRERLDLQRQQFQEQLRQQSVRDLRTREADIARSIQGGARPQSPAVKARLLSFQRRGTFASRVGLVDAIERELSSALKPRW